MKVKTIIIELFILLPNITMADIKYNPFNGQWESTPRDSSLKYNPFDGDWSHERSDSNLKNNHLKRVVFTTLIKLKKFNYF